MSTSKFGNKVLANAIRQNSKIVLEHFREFNLEIEAKFNRNKNRLEHTFKHLNHGEKKKLAEYYADKYYKIQIELHRQSTLVSIYSFLEHSLNSLCRHLCNLHDYPVKFSSLDKHGIETSKSYLKDENLANVNFSLLNGEWSDLCSFKRIRNCIVHANANVEHSRDKTKVRNIINNTTTLKLENCRYIKIEHLYIDSTINTVESFMEKLYNQTMSVNT